MYDPMYDKECAMYKGNRPELKQVLNESQEWFFRYALTFDAK